MSDEQKTPQPEEETTAAEQTAEAAQPQEAALEEANETKKESKQKKKTVAVPREQMEQLELSAKQLETVKDQYLRLAAEYDNYRKRTTKEKEGIYQDAKAETIKPFLAVYDNLERALKTGEESDSPHKKGMEMIFSQYREVLKNLGVTEMEAQGQPFDPAKHCAVMHVDDESLGENVVADVLQAGFLLGDRVLRFATVRVAN